MSELSQGSGSMRFDILWQIKPLSFQLGDEEIVYESPAESSESELSEACQVMPAGSCAKFCPTLPTQLYILCILPSLLYRHIFIKMKPNRDCVVLCLCFVFLALGLGLVAAVVSLSPSLGTFNTTQVYVPEDTQRDCVVNCTIVPISEGGLNHSSMLALFMLICMTVGISLINLA